VAVTEPSAQPWGEGRKDITLENAMGDHDVSKLTAWQLCSAHI
jgi:hypothetical protein